MIVSVLMWTVFYVTITYLIVIGIATYGWFNLPRGNDDFNIAENVSVSIIIAVRNESANIKMLLNELVKQDYNDKYLDIIIVNDHSTDDTLKLIHAFKINNPTSKIKIVEAAREGKKNAIKEGVNISEAELIVTTDGDCSVKPGWIKNIVRYYVTTNCKLILGPVVYKNEKTILQKFFSLDFISLVAYGAGSAGVGLPLMGNGANIAFSRELFISLDAQSTGDKYASGDDVFLIHNVKKKHGAASIGFLRNSNVIVSTLPPKNIYQFFKQRSRWASKATGYKLLWPIIVAITVFLFNLLLSAMLIAGCFFTWLLPVYLLMVITKLLIDLPLVFSFLSFTEKSKLKPLFLITEIIYPVYIVIAAITSFFFSFEWKGRKGLR